MGPACLDGAPQGRGALYSAGGVHSMGSACLDGGPQGPGALYVAPSTRLHAYSTRH